MGKNYVESKNTLYRFKKSIEELHDSLIFSLIKIDGEYGIYETMRCGDFPRGRPRYRYLNSDLIKVEND